MEAKAIAKYVGVSQKKAMIVAQIVKSMEVSEALNVLKYLQKGSAKDVYKVVASAAANAENLHGVKADKWLVKNVIINQGPSQRRIIYKGKGGYAFFNRPTAHITVILDDQTGGVEAKVGKKASKKAKATKSEKSEKKVSTKVVKEKVATKVAQKAKKSPKA